MTLDQARRVMDASIGPNPPRYGDWQVAGEVIARHYRDNPHLLTPTTLSAGTRLTRDATPVRSRRLMRLDLPRSRYRIISDADGSTWLEEVSAMEGAQTGRPLPATVPQLAAVPPLTGDAVQRYHALNAARENNAAFARSFNAAAAKRWGHA